MTEVAKFSHTLKTILTFGGSLLSQDLEAFSLSDRVFFRNICVPPLKSLDSEEILNHQQLSIP
jgi:hypothetical protein